MKNLVTIIAVIGQSSVEVVDVIIIVTKGSNT